MSVEARAALQLRHLIVILLIFEMAWMWQHGKDFDAIQNVLTQKLKKRPNIDIAVKTKEQIRHFYYRTLHKISRYVNSSTVEGRSSFLLLIFAWYGYFCFLSLFVLVYHMSSFASVVIRDAPIIGP